ncbi:MAG: ankyrin repeat domain-containing protein [bacterium]
MEKKILLLGSCLLFTGISVFGGANEQLCKIAKNTKKDIEVSLREIKALVESQDIISGDSKSGVNGALKGAAKNNRLELVKFLIESKSVNSKITSAGAELALLGAARKGLIDIVELLLNNSAVNEMITQKALLEIVASVYEKINRLEEKDGDEKQIDIYKKIVKTIYDKTSLTKEAVAAFCAIPDNCLISAVQAGNPKVVECLLGQKTGFTSKGFSQAIKFAARNNKNGIEIIEILMNADKESNLITSGDDKSGFNGALRAAIKKGNTEIVQFFLKSEFLKSKITYVCNSKKIVKKAEKFNKEMAEFLSTL